ncbi:MAG: SUMF1/EgtB/PvdO family nonheme iron enzyme [Verrucomicrobiota bacterium]
MDNDEANPEESGRSAQNREGLKHRILKPGDSFGNFRVVKCICAGLITNYYHMQHIRDLHDVTVGIFHYRAAKDTKFLKRLEALQKKVKTLDHEGVPKVHDYTEIDGQACIFLDPIKGQTLSQYFDAHGSPGKEGMGVEITTRILAHLLGLLGYAHSHGLDHRDLDSDLIFIQEDGSVRVLGFGIKAALSIELFESIVSASVSPLFANKTVGRLNSFDIMSPEYQSGLPEDTRVDVYCAGVIGYWLLTGQKPEHPNLLMPTALVEGVPSRWDAFFTRILERNPDLRFQSCKMALLALKETDDEPESERAGVVQRQIDRMPVPKSIRARGELATRIYRLTVIGCIGLTLTALASFFLRVSFMEEKVYTKDVAQRIVEGQDSNLRIKVQPPVAKLVFKGFTESFIANEGLLELRVAPGKYEVRATAPHHFEDVQTIEIAAAEPGFVADLEFELKPAWTDIQIRSEPGASVSVVDTRDTEIELGFTNEEGIFFLKKGLFAGVYQIVVKKEGYQPTVLKNQELDSGEVSVIEVELAPLPASLAVRTTPTGARILINDIDVGLSPATVDDIIPSDQYLIVAQLDDYRAMDRRVEIRAGEDITVDFGELTRRSAELNIEIDFAGLSASESRLLHSDTVVTIGELRYPYNSAELKFIPEGEYMIHVEHAKYISKAVQLTLEDRDVKKLEFTLLPRPAEVQLVLPGNLEPAIRLNRKQIEFTGEAVIIPAKEPVEFELRIQNYLTMVRKFVLEPNEKVTWNVTPVPIPGPTEGQTWTMPYFGFKFAWVPPGEFTMGSPMVEQGRLPNEGPKTKVTFTKGFWAGIYEVSQAEFREVVGRNPSEFRGADKPVDSVLWQEAVDFCKTLTRMEREAGRLPVGFVYRLPTEAEWEYAARGKTISPFHFGETADATSGNFRGIYPRELEGGQRASQTYGSESVGSYRPNAYGLYDVHGNISEWTLEVYNGRLDGGQVVDPAPRTGGKRFAVRGGSWEDFAVRVRSAVREDVRMDTESNAIGFRVFIAPEK